jgi:hypothetical protein
LKMWDDSIDLLIINNRIYCSKQQQICHSEW